ncbi:MAG TPA: ATP-dependent Clp protease proteolytic subunit, partial [Candidatus Limnocylindrales bacterium]
MTRHLARRPSRQSIVLALFGLLLLATGGRGAGREVVVLPTTGIVDQVMARYLADGIARAEREDAAAVVIKLNTPGGDLFSTNDIVGTLLEAKVPVIVWVAPAGGFAASAGTFITLASNIALMAPGTSIGAASPVGGQGETITGTEGDKIRNDAIAKIT